MKGRGQKPLLALTSAALALPAIAATQPVQTELSVRASRYEEDSVSKRQVLSGSDQRYEIDVQQFYLLMPVARDWSVAVGLAREHMSGASPWGTVKGIDGDSALIMTGATIHESRTEVSTTVTRYLKNSSLGIGITHSEEDDYEADAVTIKGDWDFNDRLTTIALDFSYSSDTLRPSAALTFGRVPRAEKQTRSFGFALTQVLDKFSVFQAGLSFTESEGFLSDPYKLRDVRPETRHAWSVNSRYRKYFVPLAGTLHVDYRYYTDNFGIQSHTLVSRWHQDLTEILQLVPSVRYYRQKKADFYLPTDDFALPLNVHQSSDHRLSTFGAVTFGIKGILKIDDWTVTASFERYLSAEKYGSTSADQEHPGLVSFNVASIGFDLRI